MRKSDRYDSLEATLADLKEFKLEIKSRYVKNDYAELGSPWYFFVGIVNELLDDGWTLDKHDECRSLETMREKARIMFGTYRMRCPSSNKKIWTEAREDYVRLIEIVKKIMRSVTKA